MPAKTRAAPKPVTRPCPVVERGRRVPCGHQIDSHGYCATHARRWRLYGHPLATMARVGGPVWTPAILTAAGLTNRQLDYWCSRGYLQVPIVRRRRTWPPTEQRAALLIHRLTAAGLDLATAARIAREVVDHPEPVTHPLGPGIALRITEPLEHRSIPF